MTNLTQMEANALLALEKVAIDETPYDFPGAGGALRIPLRSRDRREEFLLDVRRGRIDVAKVTFQSRARVIVVLARLDLGTHPHTNPDLTTIGSPHLHIYREGYADKWATEVPDGVFSDLSDPWVALQDFMTFCTIVESPLIRNRLMP